MTYKQQADEQKMNKQKQYTQEERKEEN